MLSATGFKLGMIQVEFGNRIKCPKTKIVDSSRLTKLPARREPFACF